MASSLIRRSNALYFIAMIFPAVLLMFFFGYVITNTALLSFYDWDGLNPAKFVGLNNFLRLISDFRFFISLRNIAILIAATIILQVGLGIILAFFLTDLKMRLSSFFKMVIFMPVVISNVAVSLYFLTLYDFQNGTLNFILSKIGFNRINFLASGSFAILYAITPQTWQYIGLMFIISFTAFTTVSSDLIDAANIDGLNARQRLSYVYVPVSWSSISVCFVIAMVGPLKSFEHIWIVTTGGGSDQKSHIPGTLMFYLGFSNFEYGYGSAMALVILILAITLVWLFRFLTRRRSFN